MNIKQTALFVGLMSLGLTGLAQADIRASAFIDVTNLTINKASGVFEFGGPGVTGVFGGTTGTQLIDGTDINVTGFTNTSDQDVTLGALTAGQSNPGSTSDVDFAPSCVGACPAIVDNAFPVLSGATASNFAAADQRDIGTPIIGLGNPGDFAKTNVDVGNGSYISIDTGSTAASANSNNNLNAGFNFTLAQATALAFVFDVRTYLEAFVTADETSPSFATAATNFNFTITDVTGGAATTIVTIAPNFLNQTVSLNAPLGFDTISSGTFAAGTEFNGSLEAFTPVLLANRDYQLSARINTNVDGSRVVPEPSAIALLGMGLLGFAFNFRRPMA